MRWSREAMARSFGARAAAAARRSSAGSAPAVLDDRSEGLGVTVGVDVGLRGVDDPPAVRLGLLAGRAPGGDPVAAEDHADRRRVGRVDGGDVQPELEAGAPPGHPDHPVPEDLLGQRLTVGGGGDGDPGVGMEVVDVRGVDQRVHGGVDRGGGPSEAVPAEVEGRHHLVLPVLAGIHVDEGAHPVEAEDGQAVLGEGPEVTAGALHPQQVDVLPRHRVDLGARGRRVAAGEVGDAGIGAQPVRPGQQVLDDAHAPQPAWSPPTRSAAICSA